MTGQVQGYLAYKTPPPRRTLQQDHAQAPVEVLWGGVVSYKRGTPVGLELTAEEVGGVTAANDCLAVGTGNSGPFK